MKWRALITVVLLGLDFTGRSQFATNQPSELPADRLPRTNLLVFHHQDGSVLPVKVKADWQSRRAEILRGFEQIAGPLPGPEKRCALNVRVEERKDGGTYEQQLLTFASEPGSRVPAYLLVPKAAREAKGTARAILCLHPTDMEYGHRVTVEPLRENYPPYAKELAERGFVTLAPAYPLMANYQPDLKALGWRSGTLKAVWDNLRALDLLDSLPYVKAGNYGVIGHSLGGHNGIYTSIFDERIKVVVSSCGFDSFADYYHGNPANWQPERGWCQTRYMPKLADYRDRLEEIPFDFHELIGALAPREVFINAPLNDNNFQAQSVDAVVQSAATVFELFQARKHLLVVHPPAPHAFPEAVREQAYRILADNL